MLASAFVPSCKANVAVKLPPQLPVAVKLKACVTTVPFVFNAP